MVRTYKEDNILGYRVKYIDAGFGMIFAQVPSITTQNTVKELRITPQTT